jgi:hypothetical protein
MSGQRGGAKPAELYCPTAHPGTDPPTMGSIRRGRSFGAAFVNSCQARSAAADAGVQAPNPAFCRAARQYLRYGATLPRRIGNPCRSGVKSSVAAITKPLLDHDYFHHDHEH